MKRILLLFISMCLLQINLVAQQNQQVVEEQKTGILFRELSFSEALKVAGTENKLIFVDCYTTWCGPCKMLSQVVFKDSLFADYFNHQFVNLKIDMEKGEGRDLCKKYDVRGFPTLLFLDSDGKVVHRLIGARKAPELLNLVKLGVESGGLSGLRKRYETGERDFVFISEYVDVLSQSNLEKEAGLVAANYLKGSEQKMLEDEKYFDLFNEYVHDVHSTAFQFVVNNKKELCEKYPRHASNLNNRLLRDWIENSYAYLKVPSNNECSLDEQGLKEYIGYMKNLQVAEAEWIGEQLRLAKDGNLGLWTSFVERCEKLLASQTILGDDQHLLEWAKWVNGSCADSELRKKVAGWCENAAKELLKRQEEIKKNLPPGAIPAISMVDYKSQLLQTAEKLRKPKA